MITNHSEELKLADNYLKLKNDVAEFTALVTNKFLKANSPTTRPILGAIVESEEFKSLVEQTK